jgi:ABC-2 type transport system ATP-binding protein
MTDSAVLSINNLSKTFHVGFWRKKVEAVRDVSFDVHSEEIFGLVGPNGAGKTTTMKMITGLIYPDAGEVEVFGHSSLTTESRRKLGYLPEGPYFYEHLTATELLRYYGHLHGMNGSRLDERVDELLERVGLTEARDRPLRKFSKGMRQRAGIAQALINDPELVILDEPQSGLDPVGRKEVRDLIYELREQGKTVIFSSHILVDVEAVCDRVAILQNGELVEVADLEQWTKSGGQSIHIRVKGLGADRVRESVGDVTRVETHSGELDLAFPGDIDLAAKISAIEELGGNITGVQRSHRGLEEQFLADTGHSRQ